MIETEIIYNYFYKQSSNKQPRAWKLIKLATLFGTQIFINYYLKLFAFTKVLSQNNNNNNNKS